MEEPILNHKWLFPEEELINTPSVRTAGVTLEQELTFRQKQAMLIQTIGLKSGLTQLAVNTSVIFMHRFFMYRTVKAFPRVQLALGFAFAGGKVEESARKLEHLIRTAVEVIRHNRNKEFLDKSDPLTYEMDCQWRAKIEALCQNNCSIESAAYLEMRKLVLECETEIYAVIGFQLQVVHPHNYVIRMCGLLGAENIKDISQYAYNLATASSQLTMLCLKYRPETIATMCLNIASKAHSVRFEPMKDSNVKWFQVIVPNTDFAEIEAVSEEFLHLIKGCPLLPSWMTNLARMSRVNNNRAMPGPSRGPGASSVSAPPGGRQSLPATATSSSGAAAASGSVPAATVGQGYPQRPPQPTVASVPTSQGIDARQPAGLGRAPGPQLSGEVVISPNSKQSFAEGGGSTASVAASDAHLRETVPSSHSRPHSSGGTAQMRPPQASSAAASSGTQQHHHHQQHRAHPPGVGRPASQTAVPPAGSTTKPLSKAPQPPGSTNTQSSRPIPTHQSGQPHTAGQPPLPRSTHDHMKQPQTDSAYSHDQPHPHSDSGKISHDPSRVRDPTRPYDPARPQEVPRHSHSRPDRRSDISTDTRRVVPQPDLSSSRSQPSRTENCISQHPDELSPHTPPTSPPPVKSASPVDSGIAISQYQPTSGDATDASLNTSSSPENLPKSQSGLESQKQRSLVNQGPKLSLTMYRERTSAKSRTPVEQVAPGEETSLGAADELYALGSNPESATNSPAGVSLRHSVSNMDMANFSKPQDSPSNPRIKIKVKRDPSSGERHAVKYADSGLRIKIKPIRSETAGGTDGDSGPSNHELSSSSSTPREEGEIVEDTPPSSGDSEQKAERLKIRLSVPKSDHSSSYSRREGEQGSNGYSGERESGHRSHHHGHHRSHHHSKSKKHSKHDRSRYEGKSSSKRSTSTAEYYDERPSKSARPDTYTSSGGEVAHRLGSYPEFSSTNVSSRILQQQNSGFSINDAFSSTMPHNIFDDDDDPGHTHPPITPTTDAVPPHHERFHQLMAIHRAKLETSMKPPLPKGPPPPPSSPPPPPPPPTL